MQTRRACRTPTSRARDIADVRHADVFVLCHGPSTRGGKWVELGLAMALRKPVLILVDAERCRAAPRMPVFAYADGLSRVDVFPVSGVAAGHRFIAPRTWPGAKDFWSPAWQSFLECARDRAEAAA